MIKNKYNYIKNSTRCIRILYGASLHGVENIFNEITASYFLISLDKGFKKQNNIKPYVKELLSNKKIAINFAGLNFEELLKELVEQIIETKWQGRIVILSQILPNFEELRTISKFKEYCSLHEVYPLGIPEITQERPISTFDYEDLILSGALYDIWKKGLIPHNYYKKFYEESMMSSIRKNFTLHNYAGINELLKVIIKQLGRPVNVIELCKDIQVDVKTVNSWLSILTQLNLIYCIKPINLKFKARVVKSFKIFFKDTGLACYLAEIKNINDLNSSPLKSALFENLVINEVMRGIPYINERTYEAYHENRLGLEFYKEHGWLEIKMLIKYADTENRLSSFSILMADIKFSQSFNPELVKNLAKFARNLSTNYGEKSADNTYNYSEKKFLIYAGKEELEYDNFCFIPLHKLWSTDSKFLDFFKKVKSDEYEHNNKQKLIV